MPAMYRSQSWDLVDEEASSSSATAHASGAGPTSVSPTDIGRIEGDHIILNEDQVFQPPLPPPVYVALPVFATPMPKGASSVRYQVPPQNIRTHVNSDSSSLHSVRYKAPPSTVNARTNTPANRASGPSSVDNRVVGRSNVLAFLSPEIEVFHRPDCPLLPNRPNFRVYNAAGCWSQSILIKIRFAACGGSETGTRITSDPGVSPHRMWLQHQAHPAPAVAPVPAVHWPLGTD